MLNNQLKTKKLGTYMKFPSISSEDARKIRILHLKAPMSSISQVNIERDGQSDSVFDDGSFMQLIEELTEIQEKYPKNGKSGQHSKGGIVDSQVSVILHKFFYNFNDQLLLNSDGFWMWFSNKASDGYFCKFIKWRHGENSKLSNWCIPKSEKVDLKEGYFSRLWLRGLLGFDSGGLEDEYRYIKLGSSDIWRSHILRQSELQWFDFIKAFLDTIHDDSGKQIYNHDSIRLVIKMCRNLVIENNLSNLNYQKCKNLLEGLFEYTASVNAVINTASAIVEFKNSLPEELPFLGKNRVNEHVERRLTENIYRRDQSRFRTLVMENCKSTCVITGETFASVCNACHIKDYNCGGPSLINNGLWMRSDWHNMFDNGDILINTNRTIELKSDIPNISEYWNFNQQKIKIPDNISDDFLNWKYNKSINST